MKMSKTIPFTVSVRELKQEDIPSLAALLTSAPDDGTLYSFPNILKHPEEMCRAHINWLRPALYDYTTLIRVAVVSKDNQHGTKVVGFSSWMRMEPDSDNPGKTRPGKWRKATWMETLNTTLMMLEDKYNGFYTWLHPPQNPALERHSERMSALRKVRSRIPLHHSTIPCYKLDGLATHPDYQGCGIGSRLARWGMEKATEDGVPVFVTGQESGVGFYERALGFKRIPETEYWLDSKGQEISREEMERGNEDWKTKNDGVSGAEVVWRPEGVSVDLH
jgi:ribosomal protein S18 acetylase RimI-like enzyme